jgi:hypothetical protein
MVNKELLLLTVKKPVNGISISSLKTPGENSFNGLSVVLEIVYAICVPSGIFLVLKLTKAVPPSLTETTFPDKLNPISG